MITVSLEYINEELDIKMNQKNASEDEKQIAKQMVALLVGASGVSEDDVEVTVKEEL